MNANIEPIRKGMIMLWGGTVAGVPTGFVLCDGNNSTPDLRDNFVIGAGSTYNPNATGGGATHTHDYTGDGHIHTGGAGTDFEAQEMAPIGIASTQETGTTDAGSSLPPYYALCYIMKT